MSETNLGLMYAKSAYAETMAALGEATAAVRPGEPNADPRQVFDPPYPVRNQAPDPGYDAQTEAGVRAAGAKLGIGRQEDVLPSALNLPGEEEPHLVASSGLIRTKAKAVLRTVNKALAERPRAVDQVGGPAIVVTGSLHRKLGDGDGKTEVESLGLALGTHTEYDGTVATAAKELSGFTPIEPPVTLPFGYRVIEDDPSAASKTVTCEATNERTGQVQLIGHVAGQPVIGFGIDAVPKVNPETDKPYFKPPDVAGTVELVDAMLRNPDVVREAGIVGGDTAPMVFFDSATYEPSRKLDTARAAIKTGRPVGLSTYGTDTLAEIKGETPTPPDIKQLPGELHRAAEQAAALGALLTTGQ